MPTAIIHKDLDDEGRHLNLGERSFAELPRVGELIVTDDGQAVLNLQVVQVQHVASLVGFVPAFITDGHAELTTHLYCKVA